MISITSQRFCTPLFITESILKSTMQCIYNDQHYNDSIIQMCHFRRRNLLAERLATTDSLLRLAGRLQSKHKPKQCVESVFKNQSPTFAAIAQHSFDLHSIGRCYIRNHQQAVFFRLESFENISLEEDAFLL